MAAAQAAENHRDERLDLIFIMRDIYISSNLNQLAKFTSRSKSTEFKDILPCNISQMIMKTAPIRIVISYVMKSLWKLRQQQGYNKDKEWMM